MRFFGILFVLGLFASGLHAEVKIVAHRGASADAIENTMEAFQLAWELGADAIEADFRMTEDGYVVCIHDADTRRVSGRQLVVEESSFADLRALELKSRHHGQSSSYIPTLEEVLAALPVGKSAYLEIKSDVRIVGRFLEIIRSSNVASSDLVIISFDSDVLCEIAQLAPELKTLLLVSLKRHGLRLQPSLELIIEKAQASQVDGISVKAHPMMANDLGIQIRALGYEFHVWTVDAPSWAAEMAKRGARSITTNRPDVLAASLRAAETSEL